MIQLLSGDCHEVLKTLPDASVQCCVTSPPYWGLRDYGVDGQIGLESTPDEYVATMVAVFREVKRVLRYDGTLWLNLGDSYAGSWGNYGGENRGDGKQRLIQKGSNAQNPVWEGLEGWRPPASHKIAGLKPKDLVGIPWRVAFALQADGWYLRSDIIWAKPNPMPESVTDRPTKAHEYLFLMSKSQRYYYDASAIREPATYGEEHANKATSWGTNRKHPNKNNVAKYAHTGDNNTCHKNLNGTYERNKRTVWTVATAPYSEAHFATFPPDLIKPCILAGTSARGCCPKCGSLWERIVENGEPDLKHQRACGGDKNGEYHGKATKDYATHRAQDASATKARILAGMTEKKTVDWIPTCKCGGTPIPCTVLDPFGGSGTTGMVALELGRKSILIELNPDYVKLAYRRTNITPGLQM